MSYILDALKKSDRSRQFNTTHEMSYSHLNSEQKRGKQWLIIAVVVLAVVIITALAYLFFLVNKNKEVEGIENLGATYEEIEVVSIDEESAPNQVVAVSPVMTIASGHDQSPTSDEQSPIKRSSLSDFTQTMNTSIPPSSTTKILESAESQSDSHPTSLSADFTGYDNYASVRSKYGLPDMHLDILMYHSELPKRKVYINMSAYKQGENTKEGAEVLKIGKEGVLLRYSGHDYVLTAK